MPSDFQAVPDRVVKILKLTPENWRTRLQAAYFDMFADMLLSDAGIKSGITKDVKRLRYISYDPEIYVCKDAQPLTVQILLNHLNSKQKQSKQTQKESNKEFQTGYSGETDPFKIAYKYAQNKTGECVPGNQHTFLVFFATCLNRMGISEPDCLEYVTGKLGISVSSNCISWPYRAYAADFGTWQDWKPTAAPTEETAQNATGSSHPNHGVKPVSPSTYFQPLGFCKDAVGNPVYYFYANLAKSIIGLHAAKMTEKALMQLAPLEWWSIHFPKKTGFDTNLAADKLINDCIKKGFFSHLKVRGRGAWLDNGKTIVHTGEELIIDGKRHRLGTVETEYIYELGDSMPITLENPLSKEESRKLGAVVSSLDWTRGTLDAILALGWCSLVPISGILKWRPHIWVTASAGAGKTWVNKNIFNRLTENFAYKLEGGSTEPGIRRLLGNDALSIVFDEADASTEKEKMTLENIIHLVRSSSSSDNMIAKADHIHFPRAMYSFFSIVPQTVQNADKRRVTILRLGKGLPLADFLELEKFYSEFCTKEYVQRFQARMINLAQNVLQSITVFVAEITKCSGNKELATQIGALFGGYWHTEYDEPVTHEQAAALVGKFDFTNEQAMEVISEEERCLQHILSAQLRVGDLSLAVGELVEIVHYNQSSAEISCTMADQILRRNGIRIDGNHLHIATADSIMFIRQTFRGTNWSNNHRYVLERIPGAFYKAQMYMHTGLKPPVVSVPLEVVFPK
jgi:putative DNA primase/helicase